MSQHKRRRRTALPARDTGDDSARLAGGTDEDVGRGERLQKVLAAAGIGSRRDCEEYIREGRVEVDRQVVTELGTRVDPLRHEIRVDGEELRKPQRLYYAVNKPMGVVTTNNDPSGRPLVINLVPTEERVFAVGRLDRASEGLILVTNDGEFANRLTHPRYGIEKTYLVRVAGSPTQTDLAKLTKGVYMSDGFCRVQSIAVKKKQGQSTDLVMVLNEGRNRELRRILARVGHKVLRLKRIAVGPIKLADLPIGAWRRLMPNEIEALLRLAQEKRRAAKSKRRPAALSDASQKRGSLDDASQKRDSSLSDASQKRSEPYLQKQALLSEPLSIDDLLRDDMDEGNLADTDLAEAGDDQEHPDLDSGEFRPMTLDSDDDGQEFTDGPPMKRGGVIPYEADEPVPQRPSGDRNPRREKQSRQRLLSPAAHGGKSRRAGAAAKPVRDKRPFRKEGDREPREQLGERPRESYGKKRSGQRHLGKPSTGRGPAGKTAGNAEFRPAASDQGRARPAKAGGKRFAKPGGKPGGKNFGKPAAGGKPFGKPSGKKFGKPGGNMGGKSFGKPGGKRKGRR
jgi:23S rRNA pseudouridine2605 synthase